MHRKRIGISSLLILSLLLQLILIPVNASEASTPQPTYLRIFNGNTEETYTVLYLDNEVYFPAESYEKLTNYTLISGNGTYGYQLGSKTIVINVQKREMQIPAQQYTGKIGNIITLDGIDYLPASELLPWMNVACNVHNGVLEIVPDGVSIWEIINEWIDYGAYEFVTYNDILYLVRGGRGYGSYSLKLLTARLIYNESNKCSITVDRYSFDNYDCTLRVDFVWSQGKWMIEDYKQTDSKRNEIDMFVSMSHGDIVREFIKPINEIYGLFNGAWIDAVDLNQVVYRDGVQWGYVKVTDPRFAKYSDFKAYVAQYLSDDIVDELFASDWFIQVGDDTYKLNDYGGLGSDITIWSIEYAPYARTENSVIFSACVQRIKPEAMSNTVITDNDLTEEWIYYTLEKIDEKWVFTDYTPIG